VGGWGFALFLATECAVLGHKNNEEGTDMNKNQFWTTFNSYDNLMTRMAVGAVVGLAKVFGRTEEDTLESIRKELQ